MRIAQDEVNGRTRVNGRTEWRTEVIP